MNFFYDFKFKQYENMKIKHPDAEFVYRTYKDHNLEFHKKHRVTSWKFLKKLICLEKKKIDLRNVEFPKGSFNPFLVRNCKSKEEPKFDSSCLALPDHKLINRENAKDLANELSAFDVISFDIFDTCLFRPFANPTDLFYLLEANNNIFNFCEIRRKAEHHARETTSKANFEVDIYDIYDDLAHRCFLKKEDAEKEIELEKKVCYANPYILEVFNILKKKKKKLIAISDMYLPSKVIKEILEKNGFWGFDKIYVSNEYSFNKASGKLFEIAKENYSTYSKFAHIGDNYEADIKGAIKADFQPFFYDNCNNFGNNFRPKLLCTPVGSVYKGIVNNYLYNGTCNMTVRECFGFIYAGPIVSGYLEWINEFVKNNNLEKIFFTARDMFIFHQMYNKYYKKYDNEYVTTSRFSLQQFMVRDYIDEYVFHTILARRDRGYTIKQTFNEINLGFLVDECVKYGFHENNFIVSANAEKVAQIIRDNVDKITKHFSDNEEAAKIYFKQKLGGAKRVCIVDLGWRGSIHAYLKYLLVDKWKLCDEVKGVLMGTTTTDETISLISRGIFSSFAFNHINNREFIRFNNWERNYISVITMESIFTSEEKSLLEYRLGKDRNTVEFLTYNENPNKAIIKEFHDGITKFIELFEGFRKDYREYYPISAVDAYEPMNSIINNYEYIARVIGDVLDTPYQFAGLGIDIKKYESLGKLMYDRKLIKKWPID